MQELLPHYERELSFLHAQADEFGRRFSRIAKGLITNGDSLQDPHVERMIQAFALLSARIHKRLDDDFPMFAESFLDLLYPHYLRPVPSSSIACFDVGETSAQLSRATVLPRDTALQTRALRGITCHFRTTSTAQLLPVRLASAGFRGTATAPAGTAVPRAATATLSLQLEITSPQVTWESLGIDSLRFYLDGDPSLVTALRELLTGRVLATMVQTGSLDPWSVDTRALPRLVGLDDEDALVEFDARSHTAYRLLTEYFSFPEKFNFVDIPLPEAALRSPGRTLGLHLSLGGLRKDGDDTRLLEVIEAGNLVLGCVPVTNLFPAKADPVSLTQQQTTYPVLVGGRRTLGHEVYAIDRVYRLQKTDSGETIHAFKPFYSLQHDDLLREGESGGRYWFSQRRDAGDDNPGFETEIGLVDLDFDPSASQTDSLSMDIRATNRDLPTQMSIGNVGGDLFPLGGGIWREVRLLRQPTPPYRFRTGKGLLWRLISQLSLNHLSLTGGGIDALKEMLRLYDLPASPMNQRILDGIVAIDYRPAQAFLDGEPFATLVRGTEIRLTVDEQSFVGTGLHLFAQVLDRFFALYVHLNSFTQLKLVSSRSGEVLVTCPRRSGEETLL